MNTIKEDRRKRRTRRDLQGLILSTVAAAGAIGVAFVAPNAIGAMKKLGISPHPRQEESINAARSRLLKKGLIERDSRKFLRLTKRGTQELKRIHAREKSRRKPARWDGRWRILIFDFPKRRGGTLRNSVRNSLRSVGFVLLQKSVWVYPYDCEDFIALLKTDLKIGKDMRYIIADTIGAGNNKKGTF